MKKLLNLGIVALVMMLSAACNKCKKLDCKNDASCEKRVGVCECSYLYIGEFCEEEIRNQYAGTYEGTITFPNPTETNPFNSETVPLTINVVIQGSDAHGLGVNFTFFDSRYELTGNLTATDEFVVDAQNLSVEPYGEITVQETSTGTFSGPVLNSTINLRIEEYPQFPVNLTFSGSK